MSRPQGTHTGPLRFAANIIKPTNRLVQWPVSVCCSVLQCVAESEHHQAHQPPCPLGCKCVLQRVAAFSHVFPCVAGCFRVLQCVAVS